MSKVIFCRCSECERPIFVGEKMVSLNASFDSINTESEIQPLSFHNIHNWCKQCAPANLTNIRAAVTPRIPKQATKAPLRGAAVSSMPLHEAVIPLNHSVTADFMSKHALEEWRESLNIARLRRLEGDRANAAFFLNDAAEYRRVYMAFREAINMMGGL